MDMKSSMISRKQTSLCCLWMTWNLELNMKEKIITNLTPKISQLIRQNAWYQFNGWTNGTSLSIL